MMSVVSELVTIGKILRPFGVHGDVRVESLTDVPGRFESLPTVTLAMPTGESFEATITHVRKMHGAYAVRFSAFSTPEEAGRFRGALVQMQQESVPPLPPAQYYHFELIGLDVHDETGRVLGKLEDILELPHQHLFVVRQNDDELLIPAVRHMITHVNKETGIMTVLPLEQWDIHHAV